MDLNECKFRSVLTTCRKGKKCSTEDVSDIQNTIIQSSKSRSDTSLFHMKIIVRVTISSHQDRGQCYLHLPIFSYTYTLLFCGKITSCCDRCFPQQIRPQITVQ